jgi:hypothetical protein
MNSIYVCMYICITGRRLNPDPDLVSSLPFPATVYILIFNEYKLEDPLVGSLYYFKSTLIDSEGFRG